MRAKIFFITLAVADLGRSVAFYRDGLAGRPGASPASSPGRRGNLAVRDVDQLAAIVKNRLRNIQYRPDLIKSFLAQTGLTLDRNRHRYQTLSFQAL